MKLLAKILGFALATAATFAACGAAASLALGTNSLSAGSAGVTSCGASSLSATRNVNNTGNVTQVDVGGIPAACSGETLSVTLVGAAGASLGSASTTLSGCTTVCSASFSSFGATIAGTNLTGYSFALVGS
ncbi:MAG: hypothetical protein QOF43_1200 [Gaiellaceae bacterium]|nr:hypothetical protein [Gaiellaceae bacterium]